MRRGEAEKLKSEIESLDPLTCPINLYNAIWEYLKPRNGPAPRAHLFTINGLTYPIQRDFCFAAVPDPCEIIKDDTGTEKLIIQKSKRRYSMLAYLYSVRPGDLIFFFQADPQWPRDIWNRRGFRGIWIVSSERPFRGRDSIQHPKTGYEILGECPNCGTPFGFGKGGITIKKGDKGKRCHLCKKFYGTVKVRANGKEKEYSKVLLSSRILIEPLLVFKKTSGDNRVYSDLSISPLVWVSRTDNAMGPGKGSSIRTLLPEEAAKISYMLATEDCQAIEYIDCEKYPGKTDEPIKDFKGKPVTCLRMRMKNKKDDDLILEHEFHLNLYFALHIDDSNSSLGKALDIPLEDLEYWTSEFPWGYTGDTSDFVLTLWREGRCEIYLFEFKKDKVDGEALAEILLYVPWVTQVLTQFQPEITEVIVHPVIVGHTIKLRSVPQRYNFTQKTFINSSKEWKRITVEAPKILQYHADTKNAEEIPVINSKGKEIVVYYVNDDDLKIEEYEDLEIKQFTPPPPTFTTTDVEKQFVLKKYLSDLS